MEQWNLVMKIFFKVSLLMDLWMVLVYLMENNNIFFGNYKENLKHGFGIF